MAVDDFVKKDIFDETIILKCLNCGFQEEVDYEFMSECWDEFESEYPESYCIKCNQPMVVPLDVYNRLKGIKQSFIFSFFLLIHVGFILLNIL